MQDINVNCDYIVSAKYWFQGKDESTAVRDGLLNLSALTTYNILYVVINNENLPSAARSVVVNTGELGKWEKFNFNQYFIYNLDDLKIGVKADLNLKLFYPGYCCWLVFDSQICCVDDVYRKVIWLNIWFYSFSK